MRETDSDIDALLSDLKHRLGVVNENDDQLSNELRGVQRKLH